MKKINIRKALVVCALMVLTCASAWSQTNSRWGVTAGVNYNQVHFKQSDIMPVDRMFSPLVGVTGEMNFAGLGFGVDGSVLYSLRQGKLHYGDKLVWSSVGAGDETVSMHYIDVPLHLKFKYHNLGGMEANFMPLAYVGPQFSLLMGGNHRELNKYTTVNVYLDMGIGCEIKERVQVKAGYCFSIGQSMRTKLLDENIAKNRCWNLSVTYFLK